MLSLDKSEAVRSRNQNYNHERDKYLEICYLLVCCDATTVTLCWDHTHHNGPKWLLIAS